MITDFIKSQLNTDKNLFVFIRHGEKAIETKKGSITLLSEAGEKSAIDFGIELKSLGIPIRVFSSPEFRCVQTAKLISKNFQNTDILLTKFLGEPGVQIKDEEEFNKLYETMKCREIFNEWKKGNYYDILFSPKELESKVNEFFELHNNFDGITLCITQSGTVAHLGYVLNKKHYDVENAEWVEFLDGFCVLA